MPGSVHALSDFWAALFACRHLPGLARACRAACRAAQPSSRGARRRYSWFAPDTSGDLFSWIGDTASLLNGNSLTSVGQLYTGAAAALINAQTEGRPYNLTSLGMSPTEVRNRAAL